MMYVDENDGLVPSAYQNYNDQSYTDVWNLLLPYTKSADLFLCPDRTLTGCTGADTTGTDRCIGYGFNWGPTQNFVVGQYEGGLMDAYYQDDSGEGARGRSESSITEPARTFAIGDTHDRTWYTVSINTIASTFTGSSNHELVHGGQFNTTYADGHAKSKAWKMGYYSAFHFGPKPIYVFPKDSRDWGNWCADPEVQIAVTTSGLNGGTQFFPCKDVVAWYADHITEWGPD